MDVGVDEECVVGEGLVHHVVVLQDVSVPAGLHVANLLLVEEHDIDELHVRREEFHDVDATVEWEAKRPLVQKNGRSKVNHEVFTVCVQDVQVNVVDQLQRSNNNVQHHLHTSNLTLRQKQPGGESSVVVSQVLDEKIPEVGDGVNLLPEVTGHHTVTDQVVEVIGIPHDSVLASGQFVQEGVKFHEVQTVPVDVNKTANMVVFWS